MLNLYESVTAVKEPPGTFLFIQEIRIDLRVLKSIAKNKNFGRNTRLGNSIIGFPVEVAGEIYIKWVCKDRFEKDHFLNEYRPEAVTQNLSGVFTELKKRVELC